MGGGEEEDDDDDMYERPETPISEELSYSIHSERSTKEVTFKYYNKRNQEPNSVLLLNGAECKGKQQHLNTRRVGVKNDENEI